MSDYIYNELDDVEESGVDQNLHTEESLRQRLAFDIVPDRMLPDAESLGLHGCSEEVFNAEMEASRLRRNNIGPILPIMSVLARLSSEVVNASILVEEGEDSDVEISSPHVLVTSVGILATLVDMGVVHLPHPVSGAVE